MSASTRDTKRSEQTLLVQEKPCYALRTWNRNKYLLFIPLFIIVIIILMRVSTPATAAIVQQQATPTPNPNLSIGNDTCLECHGKSGLTMKLANGDVLDLYVNPQNYDSSIHGKDGYACVQCHTTVGNYPHPPFSAADRRDASIKLYPACFRCHSGEYERSQDSVHATAMAAGIREAAICTDCHTAHMVRQLNDPQTHQPLPGTRTWIPQVCAQCHNAIYQEYLSSVHGSALIGEGNPDVPTCVDCHGVHNISNPLTNAFRLNSPQLCAKCHTDPKIMAKYGISTNVLSTYVADFHGTTVNIFEKESPDAPTNKPVCFDCHGVHNIVRVDDPKRGLDIEQNLLVRCKVCHPNATTNFPTAWLSHYIPSPKQNSLVYYVGIFYKLLIPTVLGGMALLVVMDFSRRTFNRYQRNSQSRKTPSKEAEVSPEKTEGVAAIPEPLPAQDASQAELPEVPSVVEMPLPGEAETSEALPGKEVSTPGKGELSEADLTKEIPLSSEIETIGEEGEKLSTVVEPKAPETPEKEAGKPSEVEEPKAPETPAKDQSEPNQPADGSNPPQQSGEEAPHD